MEARDWNAVRMGVVGGVSDGSDGFGGDDGVDVDVEVCVSRRPRAKPRRRRYSSSPSPLLPVEVEECMSKILLLRSLVGAVLVSFLVPVEGFGAMWSWESVVGGGGSGLEAR